MAQQTINVGTAPNDGTGTPLRTAFQYTNSNFSELYTAVGPSGNNIVVPGNATITGDLTVNSNVNVGASPAFYGGKIATNGSIAIAGGNYLKLWNSTGTGVAGINAGAADTLTFSLTNAFTTAMTLNSTGLGVGGAPISGFRLNVNNGDFRVSDNQNEDGVELGWSAGAGSGFVQVYNRTTSAFKDLVLNNAATITATGNVGIGVTPSAWQSGLKALQFGGNGVLYANGTNTAFLGSNYYTDSGGTNRYIVSNVAAAYGQVSGAHQWFTAPSGTAGNAATFTQAMTLDASGRLGVGVVPASNTRTHFKGSSTSTDYINYCVNSSDKLAFGIRNDGLLITGSSADSATLPSSPYNLTTGSAANVFVDSQGIFYRSTSSLKYKTDIADSTRGLADVLKLRPVTYKAKNSGDTVFGGLIAEEVDAAGLTEFVQYAPDNTPDAIHYGNMVSLLVAAIKELTARIQTLETR